MHGGGFVGGDKSDITGYAVELATKGYTVVNINYALAPKRKYPTPVLQLGEAYEYIKENTKISFKIRSRIFCRRFCWSTNIWTIR